MAKQFSMQDLEPLIREVISKGSTFTMIPRGTSMLPLFREGIDSVILSPLPEKIQAGDIILYKRDSGQFVLHRVMKVKNGIYTMCGDNQVVFEKGILKEHMIAIASGIIRDDNEVTFSDSEEYLAYTKKILRSIKLKKFLLTVKRPLKKISKMIHIVK